MQNERVLGEGSGRRCLSSSIDEGSTESLRYYLSRKTVLEMLRDRGYRVPISEMELSLEEFRAIHDQKPDVDRLRLAATHKSNPSRKILVLYSGPRMVKVSGIRSIAAQIVNKDSLYALIFIVENGMTNQAEKALDLFSFKVEVFQISDLLINITRHELQPKLQILTAKEKKSLLQQHNIEEKQLPRLLKTDAIARYYGLQKCQVVKVSYSADVDAHVTYRCVW